MNIGDLVLRLIADGSRLVGDVKAAADKAGEAGAASLGASLSKGLTSKGKAMESLGSSMTRNITLPIVGAGAAIVATGVQFDTTLRQIVALTDVTADEIGNVRKEILALAPAIGKSPEELAQGFYFLASAGFNTAEAMDVLKVTAKASAVGLGTTADISQVVGAAINAFGKENLTASDAVDQLLRAVKDGTAEAPQFAGALGDVLGSAAQLGATFADTTAAISAMTLKGIGADEAATSLNQVFVSLIKTTPQAEEGLAAVGLSSEALREQLKEKGLLSVLQTLSDRFEGNDTAAAAAFGNVRALRGILALTTGDAAATARVFEDVAHGTANLSDAFAETEGPGRKIDRAMADIQATLIDLSADVLPVFVDILKEGAGVLKTVTATFKSLPDPVRSGVVQILALTAALGPLLFIGGKVTKGLGGLVGIVAKLGGKVGAKLGARLMAGVAAEVASSATGDLVGDALGDAVSKGAEKAGKGAAIKAAFQSIGLLGATYIGLGLAAGIAVLAVAKMIADQIDAQKAVISDAVGRAVEEGSLTQLRIARDAIQKQLESQKLFGVIPFEIVNERSGPNGLDAQLARLQAEIDRRTATVPNHVGDILAAGQAKVAAGAQTMVGGIVPEVDGAASDAGKAAQKIPESIATGIIEKQNESTDAMHVLREAMRREMSPMTEIARNVGILTSNELAKGLKDKRPGVRREAERVKAIAEAALVELIAGGGKAGKGAMEELRKKMHSKNPAVRREAQRVYNIVTGKLNAIKGPAGSAGSSAGAAFISNFKRSISAGGIVTIKVRTSDDTVGGRASGGPVLAGRPYWVNEHTPRTELFVPSVSGQILTHAEAVKALTAVPLAQGGDTITIPITMQGALPVRTIRDISREMQRVARLGLVPEARLSPTYRREEATR